MYTSVRRIPRITPAKLALLNDLAPGLTAIADIPVIVTESQVREYIMDVYSRNLDRYEYVRDIEDITLDAATQCWHVTVVISGD